jgi:NAD(P)-dependent dehydrogenase (short-subunit alcohol dehydrogenase family)
MFNLTDKVVVITGAAGGLGKAFALAFAEQGAKIAVCDKNIQGAIETASEIKGAIAIEVDVANEQSTQRMAQQVMDAFGRIDVLVNNAAIYATIQRKPFLKLPKPNGIW